MPPRPSCDCGKCPKCRQRERERQRRLNPDYKEKQRAYSAARYRSDPAVREKIVASTRRWRQENPEAYAEQIRQQNERAKQHPDYAARHAAREATHRAIAAGVLTREGCEVCGARAEAHHEDYADPLSVRWLCRTHHMEQHRRVA